MSYMTTCLLTQYMISDTACFMSMRSKMWRQLYYVHSIGREVQLPLHTLQNMHVAIETERLWQRNPT